MRLRCRKKYGFTLIEVIVVIIVMGVLASLAAPRYNIVIEKTKASEGVQILTALMGAQKRYNLEYGSYTNNLANLDITVPASSNFNAPTVATTNPIASIVRTSGYTYTLRISDTGAITCTSTPVSLCTQLRSW